MTGPWHPTGRAQVSAKSPRAIGVCDRCGTWWNHDRLTWQLQWGGTQLVNLRLLVCPDCLDVPQPQLRTIILPADPLPILNPRPEQYDVEVPSFLMTEDGVSLLTETGQAIIWEIEDTPTPDPNNPALYPP